MPSLNLSRTPDGRPRFPVFCALFFSILVLHILGAWTLPLIDRDEPRFSEAAREMLERGDYVVPYFNNEVRFDKPPWIYWCQVLCYRIFGTNEFAARFPSAVAAALTALAIAGLGERMFDRRIGLWGAVIFTLSLQTMIHAKAAVADMWMIFFGTLAIWMGWELARRPWRRLCWYGFYGSLALGFLAKGPVAWLPLLVVWIWAGAGKLKLRGFYWWLGIPLMLGLVSLWAAPALEQTWGGFMNEGLRKHVVDRSLVAMEGHGAKSWLGYLKMLPFFWVAVFVFFLPWSGFLPKLAWSAWKRRSALAEQEAYLWWNVLVVFLVFTLVSTKLPHYILPAYPALSLLTASYVLGSEKRAKWLPRLTAIAAGFAVIVSLGVAPFLARLFPSRSLYEAAKPSLTPEMAFASISYTEPSLVWEFRKTLKGYYRNREGKQVADYFREPGPRLCIIPTDRLEEVLPERDPRWIQHRVRGLNFVKGKPMDLTIVIKPAG